MIGHSLGRVETRFIPSTQGAGIRYQNTSQIQILRHFEKKGHMKECEIDWLGGLGWSPHNGVVRTATRRNIEIIRRGLHRGCGLPVDVHGKVGVRETVSELVHFEEDVPATPIMHETAVVPFTPDSRRVSSLPIRDVFRQEHLKVLGAK